MQMLLVLGPHCEQQVATTICLVQVFNAFLASSQLTPHPAPYILAKLLFLTFPGNSPTCTFIHVIPFLHAKPSLILSDSSNITISVKASSSVALLLGQLIPLSTKFSQLFASSDIQHLLQVIIIVCLHNCLSSQIMSYTRQGARPYLSDSLSTGYRAQHTLQFLHKYWLKQIELDFSLLLFCRRPSMMNVLRQKYIWTELRGKSQRIIII